MRDNVIYSRVSENRDRKFLLNTQILMDKGKYIVKKNALYEEGYDFLCSIKEHKESLQKQYVDNDILSINDCELKDKSLYFSYVKGKSLEEKLDEYLEQNNVDGLLGEIRSYFDIFLKNVKLHPFVQTEEFRTTFGGISEVREWKSLEVTNIDAIFGNIISTDSTLLMLDYEWTFSFPIPINYVFYRCVFWYQNNEVRQNKLNDLNLFKLLGFDEKSLAAFGDMEDHFQNHVRGTKVPLWKIKGNISGYTQTLEKYLENCKSTYLDEVTVYEDYGDGFKESNAYKMGTITDGEAFKMKISLNTNLVGLRIDPGETACAFVLQYLVTRDTSLKRIDCVCNGAKMDKETYVFTTNDPQLIITEGIAINGNLEILFLRNVLDVEVLQAWNKNKNEKKKLQNELSETIVHFNADLEKQRNHIATLNQQMIDKDNHINNLTSMLEAIKGSRWQKIGNILHRK